MCRKEKLKKEIKKIERKINPYTQPFHQVTHLNFILEDLYKELRQLKKETNV